AAFVAERAPLVQLESTTWRRRDGMFLRWLEGSARTVLEMSATCKLRFVGLFAGLTATALCCASASAQDGYYLPADFQQQRAAASSFIPVTFSIEDRNNVPAPPVSDQSEKVHHKVNHDTPEHLKAHGDHSAGHSHLSDHDGGHSEFILGPHGELNGGHGDSHGGSHDDDHGSGHGGHHHLEIPPMIGSFSRGPGNGRLMFPIDRLIVVPQDNALGALGAGGAPVTFSGAGPVDINRPGTVSTVGGLQTLFRQKLRLPPQNIVGTIADNATFTTTQTLDQVNATFASTRQPYDIVGVQPPPGTYNTAVDAAFQAANTINGQTIFDPTTSGVIRSGRTESVAPAPLAPFDRPLAAGDMLDAFYSFDYVVNVPIPSPSADGLVGRSSVGANSSAVPTDRLYFDYSLVKNGVPFNRSENFDRYTIGIEKTIGEGDFSVEVRLPFAASMDHQLVLENGRGAAQTETGNALVILKHELGSNEHMMISGGLGLSLPTGSDIEVNSAAGKPLLRLVNEALHMKPFLAMAFVPDEHFFMQSFIEYDLPAGRNEAEVNLDGMGLQQVGRIRDASHLLWDVSAGYWSDTDDESVIRRWAPVMEFHFDKGFSDGSQVRGTSYRLFDISMDREVANVLAGVTLDLHEGKYFSFGFGTGVGGNSSSSDGEFRATLNWPFDFK
ncbi:MAG: hypothetical protein ACI8P0_006782, partial [Planctomycetaceae bacterium]